MNRTDRSNILPPLSISPAEGTALAVALQALEGTPFADPGRTALQKVLAVLPEGEREATGGLAGRVRLVATGPASREGADPVEVSRTVQEALLARRVLRLEYVDHAGRVTERDVEPFGLLVGQQWQLLGWCRLRDDVRAFRLDRIRAVRALAEPAPARRIAVGPLDGRGQAVIDAQVSDSPPRRPAQAARESAPKARESAPTARRSAAQ